MNLKAAFKLLAIAILALVAGFAAGLPFANAAIFGADNRVSVPPSSSKNHLARATAIALISSSRIENEQGSLNIDVKRLSEATGLCKDEPFASQPSLDNFPCTGFLVAPDLLVTAGHCVFAVNNPNEEIRNRLPTGKIAGGNACDVYSWLFDYQPGENGLTTIKYISKDREYRCKEIIYAVQNQKAPWSDYALIRLDRPVTDRTPLKINTAPIAATETLSVLGYPFGTPAKYAGFGRTLVNNPSRQSFLANVDALEGNSGGPVLNSKDEVVGILVGGTPMYNTYEDKASRCNRVNRCDDYGRNCKLPDSQKTITELMKQGYQGVGSEVQRIKPIADLVAPLVGR